MGAQGPARLWLVHVLICIVRAQGVEGLCISLDPLPVQILPVLHPGDIAVLSDRQVTGAVVLLPLPFALLSPWLCSQPCRILGIFPSEVSPTLWQLQSMGTVSWSLTSGTNGHPIHTRVHRCLSEATENGVASAPA